jgi:transmembrane sensor
MTSDAPTDELLFRHLAHQCSAAERAAVEGWLRRDPGNERRLDDMRRIWLASRPVPARDVDRMWTRLRAAASVEQPIARSFAAPIGERQRRTPTAGPARWSARTFPATIWAAALVLLAGSAAAFFSFARSSPSTRPAAAPRVYATGPAQTANIRLRDGTQAILAPTSRLTVPDDFGSGERSVDIDGRAFFDVVHDAAHPFRVRAKGTVTEDIGTRFDVSAYDDDIGVVVIVADGTVALGRLGADSAARGAEGVIVSRGERGRVGGPDGTTAVDRVSLKLIAWTEGRLSFAKTPLAQVARTIGRWYDLDVRVPDAALRRRLITADFETQSPKEMVASLATAVGGTVVQSGRTLTIRAAR